MNTKALFSKINNWQEFKVSLNSKTKLEKGQAFEQITKYYLEYNPIYKTKLKHVWLQKEIPSSVIKKLNLPSNDQGIDLIAETFEGTFWAIQCKYLQDEDQRLSHRAISTFVSLSTGIAENITYCLVCTTVDEYAKIYEGKNNIGFCNSDEWRKLDKPFFDWLRNKLNGKEKKLISYQPKPHQQKALTEAKKYFVKEKNTRGKLVFPCGAGKSLTGYWITKELKSKSIIVAVPSLSLVKQTLEVYLRESVANNDTVAWLCVCSDEGIGKNDDVTVHTNEIGVPCVTDKNFIAKWLKENSKKKTIIFTTYQSGKTIADACKIVNHEFDLGILDEAHKTVGDKNKLFSYLLFDKNIKISKRIFMTATERRYAGSSDTILSMDDAEMYGDTFATLSFKEAIELGILSDYKIITLFISDKEVKDLIQRNAFVKPEGKEWNNETEARTLASLIALRKAMKEYPIHHAVTFHSSIKKADAFEKSQKVFSDAYPQFDTISSFHVSGAMPTSIRSKIVDEFARSKKAVITNAKCLTEGVDVPNIDCVLFADPRKSTVDIVQAVGRALRKNEGKKYGYVILPVFTKSKTAEAIIESDEFSEVLNVLRSLASNDERIIEYFRDISKGKKVNKKDSPISFEIDVELARLIDEKQLIDSIQLTTWNKLAKLSWMPFEEAREFVRNKLIKSSSDYKKFCKSKTKPIDLPSHPFVIYKSKGWENWGAFLGTGNIHKKDFSPYNEASEFVKKLNLKSNNDWRLYLKRNERPENIPSSPESIYKKNGWLNWSDFLGTTNIATKKNTYLSFADAKKSIQDLKLKSSQEWRHYCKSGKKPINIPANPNITFKNQGWISFTEFLGNSGKPRSKRKTLPYIETQKYAISKKIKSKQEWKTLTNQPEFPKEMPKALEKVYKTEWKSWNDFLNVNPKDKFLSFKDAKKYLKHLKLNSFSWKIFCNSGDKPSNIPRAADKFYETEWKGWADFLGKE